MLRAPFSSEFDPSEEAEGSIDPLGLQPGYDRLADRLLPAVTVRMGHPRFLTAMALGACVCEGWDIDATAADNITPPVAFLGMVRRRGLCPRGRRAIRSFQRSRRPEGQASTTQDAASMR